eukprot:3267753-Amphidinium_carterae.1
MSESCPCWAYQNIKARNKANQMVTLAPSEQKPTCQATPNFAGVVNQMLKHPNGDDTQRELVRRH